MLETAKKFQLGNYVPAPFVLTEGHGCRVRDAAGREYLDLSAGISVLSVGHCHPTLAKAIADQAQRLMHVSNLFHNERAIELAASICARTPFSKVYFGNSGTEAIEAMLKLARRYHYEQGDTGRTELVAANHSFHGRTMGSLSVTGQPKYHKGMTPLIPGVTFIDFNDLDGLRRAVNERTAAVILEPIQAEGGIFVAEEVFLKGARELCDAQGALLLFDEVQTGYGRTGRFLAQEWFDVVPDACALAKGIGGGFPLSAMAVTEKVEHGLPPTSHASTFGGNPLACAAGLAILRIFDEEGLIENAKTLGAYLAGRLEELKTDLPSVSEVRGLGLLRGVVFEAHVDPGATLAAIRSRGVLVTLAGGSVLRLSPALNVTQDELDEGLRVITDVLKNAPRKPS